MKKYLNEIENKLQSVIILEKRRSGLKYFSQLLFFVGAVILAFSIIEALGNFNSGTRTILFYSIIILLSLSSAGLLLFFVKDFFRTAKPNYIDAARKVGENFPTIKDELVNAIQLINENNPNYSGELISAASEKIYQKTYLLDFIKVIDFGKVKKLFRLSLLSSVIALAAVFFMPALNSAAYRLMNYKTEFVKPQKFFFSVQPGNSEISKGSPVLIDIKTIGSSPKQIILAIKPDEQAEFTEYNLTRDSSRTFIYKLANVKSSFRYFAFSGDIKSDEYKIEVINRPAITKLEFEIYPPAYSKIPSSVQYDNGNIFALPGTRVKATLLSSRIISNAQIVFSNGYSNRMNITAERASAFFDIKNNFEYSFEITDTKNYTNISPVQYYVKIIPDAVPAIDLISPALTRNSTIKIGSDPKISFILKIKDDFGFSKMNLNYRLSASKYRAASEQFAWTPVPVSTNLKEEDIYFVWDLSPLILAEGEALSCFFEIFDNDNISGPKSARSQIFTVLVPSLDEILAEADNSQNEAAKDLSETFKEAEQLQREMQKISEDLKQNKRDLTWQEKDRIEKAAEKFKELGEKIEDVSRNISEIQKEMMRNNLLSDETLEKYNELQNLLNEMTSDEMKEAMRRMQESLQNLLRNDAQMSFEQLKANEEYFKKSIERTVNLLKRIQVEQKIDELIKRTEDISEKLDELKNKTEKSDLSKSSDKNELSQRQEDVSKKLNSLENEMKSLHDKMSNLKDLPIEQMQKASEEFQKQGNEKLSEEALKELMNAQKNQAMQNQQQLSSNMQSMNNQFQKLQDMMREMNQAKTFYDMMKILNDLITLSKEQEQLRNTTDKMGLVSEEMQNSARAQNDLKSNLGKILQSMSALSQKTFAISPEMGRALGKSNSEMQNSINALQNRNGAQSSQFQKRAMQHLNEAAGLMKASMDQMASGGQGGGMMSLMQQMQQLSQQQMQINQLTQMMNNGILSQEMASQMQRLAQQQELIRKSLEQMNREARESGQSKRLAANLDKILDDMKEVVADLQTEKIGDDLVKQQEKILTRMLDAQRSINERDFEENRKSNTGTNIAGKTPPALILSTDEGRNRLKEELMRAIKEGYKKDYEDLIRKYFEALDKAK